MAGTPGEAHSVLPIDKQDLLYLGFKLQQLAKASDAAKGLANPNRP